MTPDQGEIQARRLKDSNIWKKSHIKEKNISSDIGRKGMLEVLTGES